MKNCIIIIPVYQEKLNKFERISFKRCLKIFKDYTICIVTHKGLNLNYYEKIIATDYKNKIRFEYFNYSYFESINSYNSLMLSSEFYSRFVGSFHYLLIYQLDCYIFEDNLDRFIEKNIDFIGALVPSEFLDEVKFRYENEFNKSTTVKYLYNGGFSLRKIALFLDVCKSNQKSLFTEWKGWNEDFVFSIILHNENAILPSKAEALKFSFECFPEECYIENNKKLPMGCHAWFINGEKFYDDLFWFKRIIPLTYIWKIISRFIRRKMLKLNMSNYNLFLNPK